MNAQEMHDAAAARLGQVRRRLRRVLDVERRRHVADARFCRLLDTADTDLDTADTDVVSAFRRTNEMRTTDAGHGGVASVLRTERPFAAGPPMERRRRRDTR
jgi:hypothetical protein